MTPDPIPTATPDLAAELAELDALEEAPVDVDALERWLDAADAWVSDLCLGRRRWTMTVPAEPDRDSDLVIGTALELGRRAAGELRSLRARPPVDVTRWHVEAAAERLDDVIASFRAIAEEPEPTALVEIAEFLRDGLAGRAAGLTARGYTPPFYGTLAAAAPAGED